MIANALGTDTYTIATMAGTIMGALANPEPPEEIMDQVYISKEADRLYNISQGCKESSYSYPDLLYWQPPISQNKALGKSDSKWILKGFGEVSPIGSEHIKKDVRNPATWQWFRLQFGQSVLLKRSDKIEVIPENMLPVTQQDDEPTFKRKGYYNRYEAPDRLRKGEEESQTAKQPRLWNDENYRPGFKNEELTVEKAADLVVKYRFKTDVIGSLLLRLAAQESGEEETMLFAKLIARAKQARLRY